MNKKLFFILPFLGMTCGCFHSANKNMSATSSPPSIESSCQKAIISHLFSPMDLNEPWWNAFEDQQLKDLIELAIASSPTLQKAEAKVVSAQAEAKSVRSNLFPHLNVNAEENWQYLSKYGLFRDFFPKIPGMPVPSKFNEIDLSLNFSYEVDFWGKNQKMLQAALGSALAEEMEKTNATLILSTTLAFTYFTLQAHLAELILYKQQLSCEEEILSLLTERYQIGVDRLVPSLVEEEIKLSLLQKIEEVEKNLSIDKVFLKTLLGKGPEYPLDLVFTWNPSKQKAYLPDTLEIDLLSQRPDVIAQIWRIESARQEIGVAKTEFYPNVNLMAFAGLSSLSFSHLFDFGSRTGSLRPAIHLPLFTGGKLQANLQEKVAAFNKEVYAYNELILTAAKEVVNELTTFLSVHTQLEEQGKKLKLRQELLAIASSCFDKGIDTYIKVLSAKQDLLEKEIHEIQLNEYKILSAIRIIKAIGGTVSKKGDTP